MEQNEYTEVPILMPAISTQLFCIILYIVYCIYCNSLLYGLPEYQLNKLQRVQNMCARLICNESKYCHITPLLVDLHWLPVKFRIEFKILLIVFKIFRGLAPSYLSFLITSKPVSKYNLRSSSDSTLLSFPNIKVKATLGERAFVFAAPK